MKQQTRQAGRSSEHAFRVRHQRKQELLLRALEQLKSESETPVETQAIVDMIRELEQLLAMRQRSRKLHAETWRGR